jgi:hypothetical protein
MATANNSRTGGNRPRTHPITECFGDKLFEMGKLSDALAAGSGKGGT